MIYLRFEMNDPRVVLDSPNVRLIDGHGVLLEYGDKNYTQLAPGTPGYEAPPPPPTPPDHHFRQFTQPTQ